MNKSLVCSAASILPYSACRIIPVVINVPPFLAVFLVCFFFCLSIIMLDARSNRVETQCVTNAWTMKYNNNNNNGNYKNILQLYRVMYTGR